MDGEPGMDAEVLHVFDALGNDLGLFAGRFSSNPVGGDAPVYVYLEESGRIILIGSNGTLGVSGDSEASVLV
jgi:hypothetical protein